MHLIGHMQPQAVRWSFADDIIQPSSFTLPHARAILSGAFFGQYLSYIWCKSAQHSPSC
jgi:hypothetical protein